jgi:hypothetical protein
VIEALAVVGVDLLGVVEQREGPDAMPSQRLVVEEDAGHDERARERAPPRLVGACDEARTELTIELKKLPARATSHGREHSAGRSRHPET